MVDDALEAVARTTESGRPYGITPDGFVPKPLGRLLDENLAAARILFGDDLDLTSGSVLRKMLELVAMEESRLWQHLGSLYESGFVSRATGDALSLLGRELGISRPHHRATGEVEIELKLDLPSRLTELILERGARLLTPGGHDYFLDERVVVANTARKANVALRAFHPGPSHNLDPNLTVGGATPQRLDRFNEYDSRSDEVRALEVELAAPVVGVNHTVATAGGELLWSDEDYRDLLLAYPRNMWSADAVRIAVALVPGVRQVLVKDKYGGLDINQSIFGNFNFVERLFSEERSLGSPSFFTVLVAKGDGAIWSGPGQLEDRVRDAIDEIRPVGIHPNLEEALDVGIGVGCTIRVEGVPIQGGTPTAVNQSPQAIALKRRILQRVRRYVSGLGISEPVRYSEVFWCVMEEPGVVDCKGLRLRRYPPEVGSVSLQSRGPIGPQVFQFDQDVIVTPTEVAVLVEDLRLIQVA